MNKRSRKPCLSIIIPAFNTKNFYKPCLGSLLKINYPNFEIIVVDDGSNDGSYEKIKRLSEKNKKLRIIKTLKRLGIPGSRNLGIEVSNGDFIAFFDMDMEVDKSWPGDLIKVLLKRKDVGGVLPKVLDFNNRKRIQAVGFKIDPHSMWVIPKGFGEIDDGQYKSVEEISIGAAGSVFKRVAIEKVKGFDESLGMFDDIDFGWRVNITGLKTLCVPSAVIYHWTAKPWSTRPKSASLIEQDFYMNNLTRALFKNLEPMNVIVYLPQRVGIMVVRVITNLLKGNTVPLQGFLTSIFWNITHLSGTLKGRSLIQNTRQVKDKELFGKILLDTSIMGIYINYLKPLNDISKVWLLENENLSKK